MATMETPLSTAGGRASVGEQLPDFSPAPHSERFAAMDWGQLSVENSVGVLTEYALSIGASDMFLSCEWDHLLITARVIGMIVRIAQLPRDHGHRCIAHIRNVSGMDYKERRRPQDGRWTHRLSAGGYVDVRLNTIPTLHGETLAMRFLSRRDYLRKLANLGFIGPQLAIVQGILQNPSGLVLISGPAGSGKTTTIYGFLHSLNNGRYKIHTIEDPIEYEVPGLHQSQVNEIYGPTFAELLNAVLRQDPNIIMIGEVRDRQTAEIAVRAANSGQLVFATVHAPVAVQAIQSMLSLGTLPHFLSTSLVAVIGQRLIRTLSLADRVPIDLTNAPRTFEEVQPWLNEGEGRMAFAAPQNGHMDDGYTDRTGVYEILTMTPTLQRMVRDMASAPAMFQQALGEGMLDFRRAALVKVAQGITSFDEINRVLPLDLIERT